MKIISFYTEDPIYSECIKNMHQSLIDVGNDIDVYIAAIKPSDWSSATNYKPLFIQRCLREFKEPVLWVDADAIVRKPLDYFKTLDCDMACHFRRGKELLTGTIYFQPTKNTFDLIDEWLLMIKNNPTKWEQRNLQIALCGKPSVRIEKLHAGYCFIFDIMRKTKEYTGDIYVEHYQKSREAKKN